MLAKLCKGINLYFRISCPKGLKADEDVVFEEVAGKISLGVFGTVKAVEYLYVFIADEESLVKAPSIVVRKGWR